MTILDPRFAKVVALMRSTQHTGERDAARARAEEIASAAGMTFDEALAIVDAPVTNLGNIFSGFDDFMEREEPGYKARCAAEQAERRRQNAAKRAAVIAKYGSEQLALAPCGRERLILAAVARWRKPQKAPYQRWTDSLDGWSGYGFERKEMPAHVLAAIENVYPLPTSFIEARAEHDHWQMRDDELGLILDQTGLGYGDTALDTAAGVRADIVRDLVEKDMPVFTVEDLHARFAIYMESENHNHDIEKALFRDLSTIVERRHLSSNPSTNELAASAHPSTCTDRTGQIKAALDADPARSDRDIAWACNCSPTTVGKIRKAMGLGEMVRSVRRNGQMFQMRFAFEASP